MACTADTVYAAPAPPGELPETTLEFQVPAGHFFFLRHTLPYSLFLYQVGEQLDTVHTHTLHFKRGSDSQKKTRLWSEQSIKVTFSQLTIFVKVFW